MSRVFSGSKIISPDDTYILLFVETDYLNDLSYFYCIIDSITWWLVT